MTGFNTSVLMCAPPWIHERVYGAIEVVNSRTDEEFDENDLAILRVTACFVAEALPEA